MYCYHNILPELNHHIHCIWSVEASSTKGVSSVQPVIASGCMELLFFFGDRISVQQNQTNTWFKHAIVSGHKTTPIDISTKKMTAIIGVMIRPASGKALLGVDAKLLSNKNIALEDIDLADVSSLVEQMGEARSNGQRASIFQTWLLLQTRNQSFRDNRIVRCVQQLSATGGNAPISTLAHEMNIGNRQLERLFLQHVGLSPKQFARAIRFQYSLYLKQHFPQTSLTAVSHKAGFSDQAHFNREFKSFSHMTPKQYFSAGCAMSDYFNF